jgi:hypothetical protein
MRRVCRANRGISLTCSWKTAKPCISGRVDIRLVFALASRTRSNVQDVCARECAPMCATVQVWSCARPDLTKLDSKSSRTFYVSHWAAGSRFKAKLSACKCTWARLNCEPYRKPSVWHVGECCCGWEFKFGHISSRLKCCCRRESNRRGRIWHCVNYKRFNS